jgi:hypothetical protein
MTDQESDNLTHAIIPDADGKHINTIKNINESYEDKITEIHQELEDVFKIDQFQLVEENMKTVSKLHYWISKLAVERRLLIKISRKRNFTFSKLYEDYREGKNGKGFVTLTKDGIEAYIRKDSEYIYWDSMMQEQQNITDYIDQICWALKQTKMTALKNIQESKRIEGS